MDVVSNQGRSQENPNYSAKGSMRNKIIFAGSAAIAAIGLLFIIVLISMDVYRGIRAFVQAEGLWAKHQKEASLALFEYASSGEQKYYDEFLNNIALINRLEKARDELDKDDCDKGMVSKSFQKLGVHRKDTGALIRLYRLGRGIEQIDVAISLWMLGDEKVRELTNAAKKLHTYTQENATEEKRKEVIRPLKPIHIELNELTNNFSQSIGAAARWANGIIFLVVMIFSAIAGGVVLFLTLMGARMITQVEAHSKELGHEHWLKSGQSGLADVTSGVINEQDICNNIIQYLTPMVGAQVGGFYRADSDGVYRLKASHAFVSRKAAAHEFSEGQGIVGQAVLEKQPILITGVPEDYISIRSGLGETPPRNIFVYPVVFEGTVRGVLEFASIEPFDKKVNELLKLVNEAIAIVLSSAESRQKVMDLLEEAKRSELQLQELNEELQVQQEELRQSNEELEAQAKSLEESQRRLEETNAELEERGEALEQERSRVARQNQQLQDARKEVEKRARDLEMASKYKSEFLANMSHELRTPLNSINVLSGLMSENKKGNLSDKQVEFAKTIHESGVQLVNLINDILDLSKIEAGKFDTIVEKFELNDLLISIERQFKPLANEKGIDLDLNVDADIPGQMWSDQHRLGQIIRNLMSNAVKFTESGGVKLSATHPTEQQVQETYLTSSPKDLIALSVTDTGIGIPEQMHQQIFEAFQQADGATDRKYGGTGLGLAISRRLARLLGGEILLKSSPNKGCTFTIIMPIKFEPKKETQPEATAEKSDTKAFEDPVPVEYPKKELSVEELESLPAPEDDRDLIKKGDRSLLIIEDDLTFAKTLMELGHERDYKCIIALDGESGLLLAEKYLPSGILLDLALPGMDGLAVMTRLKDDLKTRHIPIHVISGREQKLDTLKAGAVGFLQKPVNQGQIDGAFNKISNLADRPIKTLLIAEGNESSRKEVVEILSGQDVQVTEASTGEEFLEVVRDDRFDCVVIGETIPDMSGVTLLEKLRRGDYNSDTPVVILSPETISNEDKKTLKRYADRVIQGNEKALDHLLDETALFLHRLESDLPDKQRRVLKMLHDKEAILRGCKVLLVDDDMRNIFALTNLLEDREVEVLVAKNGYEAIEQVKSHPEIELILMDIMMPEMDGYEAMRRIRKLEKGDKVPIIAMTAKAMRGDRAKCIEAGASDYLAKPVDTDKLLSMMRVWLYK